MCGISGFFHPQQDFSEKKPYYQNVLDSMNLALKPRGTCGQDTCIEGHFGLAQVCSDPTVKITENPLNILWDGELYNAPELKKELEGLGHTFEGPEDARIILAAYLEYGPDFVKKLNGAFAFAIADCRYNRLLLYRDRSGIKPLFYSVQDGTVVFASELKGLFAWPGLEPELTLEGLNEVFSLGPAKTSGSGVFKGILEVLPGCFLSCSLSGIRVCSYWELKSHPHEDSYQETIEKTSWLLEDAVCRQMKPDSPVCAFLSGGVDSSLVSAICARELKKKNKQLTTFSFDFTGNDKNFKANSFQPSLDKPYVEKMVVYLDSDHHFLECSAKDQFDLLEASVLAHDLPAMADVDSSLMYFCSQVAPLSPAALTGECADEIFGGYPWFHKEECFQASTFPWTMDLKARQVLLSDDFLNELKMEEYVRNCYEASLAQVPSLPGESLTEARRREISYLNLRWFMQTLLDRMDRASTHSGLKARVPFADYRIIEYLWNVPWEMKARDGIVKNLLRQAGRGQLPDEVLFRKKSPYPKTYDTAYEALLSARVREILEDSSSPVLPFIDRKKVLTFLASPSDYGKPWYGQLMAAPQMMAYLIQIDFWLRQYRPKLPDFC